MVVTMEDMVTTIITDMDIQIPVQTMETVIIIKTTVQTMDIMDTVN